MPPEVPADARGAGWHGSKQVCLADAQLPGRVVLYGRRKGRQSALPTHKCGAGLISAAPGRRNGALQNSAKQVEAMVMAKMACQEYIILCLEDTSDWSNATTRRMVMQVLPTRAAGVGGELVWEII